MVTLHYSSTLSIAVPIFASFLSKGKKARKERRLRPAHRVFLLAGRRFSFSVFSSRQRSCEEDAKTKEYSFLLKSLQVL